MPADLFPGSSTPQSCSDISCSLISSINSSYTSPGDHAADSILCEIAEFLSTGWLGWGVARLRRPALPRVGEERCSHGCLGDGAGRRRRKPPLLRGRHLEAQEDRQFSLLEVEVVGRATIPELLAMLPTEPFQPPAREEPWRARETVFGPHLRQGLACPWRTTPSPRPGPAPSPPASRAEAPSQRRRWRSWRRTGSCWGRGWSPGITRRVWSCCCILSSGRRRGRPGATTCGGWRCGWRGAGGGGGSEVGRHPLHHAGPGDPAVEYEGFVHKVTTCC